MENNKPITAEEVLDKHSIAYGSVIGNSRAIVLASEAISAMEEYAQSTQQQPQGSELIDTLKVFDLWLKHHPTMNGYEKAKFRLLINNYRKQKGETNE